MCMECDEDNKDIADIKQGMYLRHKKEIDRNNKTVDWIFLSVGAIAGLSAVYVYFFT